MQLVPYSKRRLYSYKFTKDITLISLMESMVSCLLQVMRLNHTWKLFFLDIISGDKITKNDKT